MTKNSTLHKEKNCGSSSASTAKGIVCIVASGLFFALMSLGIRLSGNLPSMEKCAFRNAAALIIALAVLLRKGDSFRCKQGNFLPMAGRAVIGTIALLLNFYANDHMNIADANVLNKLSSFVVLIFSAVLLKETFKLGHLLIVFGAFVGCLFVTKPTLSFGEMIPAMAGASGGILAGLALTLVRDMGRKDENAFLIIFYFSLVSTMITLPSLIINFRPFTLAQFGALLLTSIGGCGGQIFITKAYHYAPARNISVFDYSQVLFSAIIGYVFLDQTPDAYSLIGYFTMVTMGIILFAYNKRLYIQQELKK